MVKYLVDVPRIRILCTCMHRISNTVLNWEYRANRNVEFLNFHSHLSLIFVIYLSVMFSSKVFHALLIIKDCSQTAVSAPKILIVGNYYS